RLAVGPLPRPRERRPVFFAEAGGFVETVVYERSELPAGVVFEGPAVVEEYDSTLVVHPGFRAETDAHGNLLLRRM
ncbi:MAG: hypothetical protein NZL88_11630, partial [Gaiellaceae bacterium]|nr:hypothetical protein [Gaiellaceae bacterium]